ncbi:MAG: HAD-IB family phosphatase [Candidatus Berkiellales bacterium]
MNDQVYFLFDFDSTFIQCESLAVLADIALEGHPQKQERLNMIADITQEAMEGRYDFQESLKDRFALLSLQKQHLQQTIDILKTKITPSFLRHVNFFKKHATNIYIITGALIEIVYPIVQPFGMMRDHIFANRLIYDFEGNILGYDHNNLLAQDQGKVKCVHQLKLNGHVIFIGDGYNDYEVRSAGLAHTFVALTENIKREAVVKVADIVINDLEGLFITCNISDEE